ncbi:hypothetical protein ElyMa_000075700 [Elysia marginata]|uniref:Uncharacterized protein n=1 Tax=Elysia marginata TaxID=1093978 RepID=A0AAV4EIN4_9GAST|nr:hypothetical protein ElyMa_000075700 [Elysia marginata]
MQKEHISLREMWWTWPQGEECDKSHKCIKCKGEHPASSKNCLKYLEEQVILRYRAHNGGTFGQARAAVVVEVAKEVRPKLYAQAVRGRPTRKVTDGPRVNAK